MARTMRSASDSGVALQSIARNAFLEGRTPAFVLVGRITRRWRTFRYRDKGFKKQVMPGRVRAGKQGGRKSEGESGRGWLMRQRIRPGFMLLPPFPEILSVLRLLGVHPGIFRSYFSPLEAYTWAVRVSNTYMACIFSLQVIYLYRNTEQVSIPCA
jgi:hypothetical protein